MEILTLIGTAIAIIASAVSVYLGIKRSKPEILNTEANTEKIKIEAEKSKAEIIRIYSEEVRNLKQYQIEEQERTEKEISDLRATVLELKEQLGKQTIERREEVLRYREFISILLSGISRLTGQIQATGQPPVWTPPSKTPFDCE